MKIASAPGILVAIALVAAGYALGRVNAQSPEPPPGQSAPAALARDDIAPETAEYLTSVRAALAETMLLERTMRTAEALSQLSPANLEETVETFRLSSASTELKALLVDTWVRFDGPGALDYVENLAEFPKGLMMPRVFESWATLAPQAARRAFAKLPKNEEVRGGGGRSSRNKGGSMAALSGLARGWARSGKPGLTQFLSRLDPSMTRQEHLEFSILVRLERDGMESLTQWADEQAQAEGLSVNFRKSLLNRTAAVLSRHDGQFAADWATAYAETEFAQRVLNGVANGWVLREGDVTMRWLANLPDNEARADVIGQAYKFWLKQRREPAMDWAAGAGEKQVLEPILASYSLALAETDPKAAVDVASRISGLEARTDALVKVAQLWYGNDPGPATAWLEQSALDGEHRELVTNPPQKKKKKRPGVNRDR